MNKIIIVFMFLISFSYSFSQKRYIANWSFNDGTARDFSGNGYHGTMMNNPKVVPGKSGLGMQFQGYGVNSDEGSHILLPSIDFTKYDNFTISLWVNEFDVSNWGAEAYIFFGDHHYGWLGLFHSVQQYPVLDTNKNFVMFSVGSKFNNIEPIKVPYSKKENLTWNYYKLVYENDTIKAYKNDIYQGKLFQKIKVFNEKAAIARHWWNDGYTTSTRFTGIIDEVEIYTCDKFRFIDDKVDFGQVERNKQLFKKIKIRNYSVKDEIISDLNFKNQINFSIPSSQLPLWFKNNEEKEIEISFFYQKPGIYYDTLVGPDICDEVPVKVEILGDDNDIYSPCETLLQVNVSSEKLSISGPYPNPGKEKVAIEAVAKGDEAETPLIIEVSDVQGNILQRGIFEMRRKSEKHLSAEAVMDFEGYNDGVYFIKISYGGEVKTLKYMLLK